MGVKKIFMKEMRFALYAIKKNIQNNAGLKTSFFMNIFGMVLNDIAFIIIWVSFVKSVGVINGWTASDIIGLMGFSTFCFGFVLSVGDGLRRMPDHVSSGAFDRFLLSPKNLIPRIATSSFGSSAVGDMLLGIICLIFYGLLIHASLTQVLLILIIHCTSFLFVDSEQITLGVFNFFLTPTLFNGGAFHGIMKFIFVFIIPSLLVGAIPVEIVRDISLRKLLMISILAIFWFIFSKRILAN